MIDVHITFENAAQIRDFRCLDVCCSSCKDAEICEVIARFIEDLGTAELKYKAN